MKIGICADTYQTKNLLKIILGFAKKKKKKPYLVGGFLRDILLKREKANPDIDFCLKSGAINFGRDLSRELKCGFVVLDKEHGACRLVKKTGDKICTLDFTDFRGKTLEEDLLHRDFTINTIALELDRAVDSSDWDDLLIDPYFGREDLKRKVIRVVNKKAFDEDPIRILRAFSFACLFGFKIDQEALRLIKQKKNKLSQVSGERVRDELFKILASPDSFNHLLLMDKLGVLKIIIPEIEEMRGVRQGPYHHLDVWKHTLEAINQLEGLIKELKNNKEIQDYLNEVISSERRRYSLLKLGVFLHDIGKPRAKRREGGKTKFHGHERIGLDIALGITERLKLSNAELDALRKMVLWHLRPGYLADIDEISPRAKFRYFRDSAMEAASILVLSIADQRATKGRLTSKKTRLHHEKIALGLIKEYFKKNKEKKMPRLINGDDLIKEFKLAPSPLIGKILSEIEELQAIGKIKNKKAALQAAKKWIK